MSCLRLLSACRSQAVSNSRDLAESCTLSPLSAPIATAYMIAHGTGCIEITEEDMHS